MPSVVKRLRKPVNAVFWNEAPRPGAAEPAHSARVNCADAPGAAMSIAASAAPTLSARWRRRGRGPNEDMSGVDSFN